jgi:transcriptional regulator with GAF, ATPase, and Fis domain
MDENLFFHRMTIQICGSLNIEAALQHAWKYLAEVIPLDVISLHLYDRNLGAIRTIAKIAFSEIEILDRITPLSPEGRTSFEGTDTPNVRIVNSPESDPVIKVIAGFLKIPNSSSLVMRLVIEGKFLGSLVLSSNGRGRYTDEHARLFGLLNEPVAIALSNTLTHQEIVRLKDMLTDDNRYLHRELLMMSGDEIIGGDFGLKDVMEMVRKVAPLDSPVLLLGETGVGKGVIAGAIHRLSPRSKGPFITVNSGAIPETLIDSELFGHEKGAFTGAMEQKRGRFERADLGSIFLDEIGELPLHAQIRMLRVLQEKEIERVGGTKSIPLDIRVIAATHRDLPAMVTAKQFREDLWFRINVFPIRIPPLRERKEDIPSLVHYFIKKKTKQLKLGVFPELSPGAIDYLMNYQWPGNVRELENVIERELILHHGEPLTFKVLAGGERNKHPATFIDPSDQLMTLEEFNALYIRRVLTMTKGVVHGPHGAAVLLGINPGTLRSRMKKLGVSYGRRKNAGKPT